MFSPAVSHATSPDKSLIYLKVNPYYILYTWPQGPLIDSNNPLLIPLKTIHDLLGGAVTYDAKTRRLRATAKWLEHTFEIELGSTLANVDGSVKMDTAPLLKEDGLFIPIRLILDYTDIKCTWHQEKLLLHITDERIGEKGETIEVARGFGAGEEIEYIITVGREIDS